jgi:dCTP deaminase
VFTRVLVPGHARFDEAPPGYAGPLWLEVAPLSFPMRLARGARLVQVRLSRGQAALGAAELRRIHERSPLAFAGARPLASEELCFDAEGALLLHIGLAGREPCGWRARLETGPVDFESRGRHARLEHWEPVSASAGHCILEPGRFTLFASRERLRIPPELAAEMLPIDVGIGELRNNYAGFFDSGFGWHAPHGTPAVLEVRAHDVPFLVEDGQVFFRLRFFRTSGRPLRLYGEVCAAGSYRDQDLTLARPFR